MAISLLQAPGRRPRLQRETWLGRRHDHCPQKDQNPEHMGADGHKLDSTPPWNLDGLEWLLREGSGHTAPTLRSTSALPLGAKVPV